MPMRGMGGPVVRENMGMGGGGMMSGGRGPIDPSIGTPPMPAFTPSTMGGPSGFFQNLGSAIQAVAPYLAPRNEFMNLMGMQQNYERGVSEDALAKSNMLAQSKRLDIQQQHEDAMEARDEQRFQLGLAAEATRIKAEQAREKHDEDQAKHWDQQHAEVLKRLDQMEAYQNRMAGAAEKRADAEMIRANKAGQGGGGGSFQKVEDQQGKTVFFNPKTQQTVNLPQGLTGEPTAATKTMREAAPKVLDFVTRIGPQIDALQTQLGPAQGRWSEFMSGKVGAGDPRFTQLRTNVKLLQTLLMRMHVGARGSRDIMHHFENIINQGYQSPENMRAALGEIKNYADNLMHHQGGNAQPGVTHIFDPTKGLIPVGGGNGGQQQQQQ